MNLINLLKDIDKDLYTAYRNDDKPYITHKENSPYQYLYMSAHGDYLPDDTRYEMIQDIISGLNEFISDNPEYESIEDIDFYEVLEYISLPIYNADLLSWLSSKNDRPYYVDKAIESYGKSDNIIDDIKNGYIYEFNEVYCPIINWLSDYLENQEEEDQEEEEQD